MQTLRVGNFTNLLRGLQLLQQSGLAAGAGLPEPGLVRRWGGRRRSDRRRRNKLGTYTGLNEVYCIRQQVAVNEGQGLEGSASAAAAGAGPGGARSRARPAAPHPAQHQPVPLGLSPAFGRRCADWYENVQRSPRR